MSGKHQDYFYIMKRSGPEPERLKIAIPWGKSIKKQKPKKPPTKYGKK